LSGPPIILQASGQAQTYAQIAAALGIGDEPSPQLEHEALRRLRELDTGDQHAA
jgi:DNA-directed RNA polymerase sigma subunit (sigma70/sigma32)